eukprot:8670928-Alexandrium_andersonii.AAC.1
MNHPCKNTDAYLHSLHLCVRQSAHPKYARVLTTAHPNHDSGAVCSFTKHICTYARMCRRAHARLDIHTCTDAHMHALDHALAV